MKAIIQKGKNRNPGRCTECGSMVKPQDGNVILHMGNDLYIGSELRCANHKSSHNSTWLRNMRERTFMCEDAFYIEPPKNSEGN
jgi:hypothetical protein